MFPEDLASNEGQVEQLKKELDLKNQENYRLTMENYALKEQLEWSMKEIKRAACPLLSLPDELIGYILSFVSIKDRKRARLCKRLDNIEFNYKYYVPRLLIHERATDDPHRFNNNYITDHKQYFVLLKENVYSIDFFKRMIRNAIFGYLAINMSGRSKFHWELYNLIKECDVDELSLRFECSILNELVVDSFLIGLKNTCCQLKLDRAAQLTAAGIHSIYTIIRERSSKMHSVDFGTTRIAVLREFLLMTGIRFENGNLFSARDIEAHEFTQIFECQHMDEDDNMDLIYVHKHVYDGNLEITFGQDKYDENEGWLSMKHHQSNEDLKKAKTTKGFVRIVVNPE